MASTAVNRIRSLDEYNNDLLNKKIRLANGEYKTVQDYLIDIYPDNLDFDASKLAPVLEARVKEAEKAFIKDIVNNKLQDPKYKESIRKGENSYMSFVDYVESLPIKTLTESGIKINNSIVSFEEQYEKFAKDVYIEEEREVAEEISEEASLRASHQHDIGEILYNAVQANLISEEELMQNKDLLNYVLGDMIDEINDFEQEKANGNLENRVNNAINKYKFNANDKSEIEKLEKELDSAVSQVDEIVVDKYGVGSSKTNMLSREEIDAVLNPGLSISDQNRIQEKIKMCGPEDGEEDEDYVIDLDGNGGEVIEVQLKAR